MAEEEEGGGVPVRLGGEALFDELCVEAEGQRGLVLHIKVLLATSDTKRRKKYGEKERDTEYSVPSSPRPS